MKTPEELAFEAYLEEMGDRELYLEQEREEAFSAGYKAAQPQWISVKDRLPEAHILVVILHEDEMNLNHRNPPVYFGKHNGKYWLEVLDHSDVAWSNLCEITHWMPLPSRPEVKDEEI